MSRGGLISPMATTAPLANSLSSDSVGGGGGGGGGDAGMLEIIYAFDMQNIKIFNS